MIRLQDEMMRATRRFEASGRPISEAAAREIDQTAALREAREDATHRAGSVPAGPRANRWFLAHWLVPKRTAV